MSPVRRAGRFLLPSCRLLLEGRLVPASLIGSRIYRQRNPPRWVNVKLEGTPGRSWLTSRARRLQRCDHGAAPWGR